MTNVYIFTEKSAITFSSVQELQGVQGDQFPCLQLMGIGLCTALVLLVPASLHLLSAALNALDVTFTVELKFKNR